MKQRTLVLTAFFALSLTTAASAGAHTEIETFAKGEFTNLFFGHEFEFPMECCWELVERPELEGFTLHLVPNFDRITFDLGDDEIVESAGITILDFEGGFVGDLPTSAVIFRGANDDFVVFNADEIGVAQTFSADVNTPGQLTGKPIGPIVEINLQAANEGNSVFPNEIGAYFDNLTADVIVPETIGDLDGDGDVDVMDLLALLGAWGDCPDPPAECSADLNEDGIVNVMDLLMQLANWG
jgi:hypothetical protein